MRSSFENVYRHPCMTATLLIHVFYTKTIFTLEWNTVAEAHHAYLATFIQKNCRIPICSQRETMILRQQTDTWLDLQAPLTKLISLRKLQNSTRPQPNGNNCLDFKYHTMLSKWAAFAGYRINVLYTQNTITIKWLHLYWVSDRGRIFKKVCAWTQF